jgi:hypothetical protein
MNSIIAIAKNLPSTSMVSYCFLWQLFSAEVCDLLSIVFGSKVTSDKECRDF